MKKIELNKVEHEYLISSSFLPLDLKKMLNTNQRAGDSHIVMITEEQADEFRDLFGEQLQLIGFDEHYNPTREGKILESLIDKFFCE